MPTSSAGIESTPQPALRLAIVPEPGIPLTAALKTLSQTGLSIWTNGREIVASAAKPEGYCSIALGCRRA